MQIDYFCPRWGSEKRALTEFLDHASRDGYDGVETVLPRDFSGAQLATLCRDRGLKLIGQCVEAVTELEFEPHKLALQKHLTRLLEAEPLFVNAQTGKDYFSFEQNCELVELTDCIASSAGVPVVHEIHRGKFTYAPMNIVSFIERLPALEFCADLSHWVAVSESLLSDSVHQSILESVLPRCRHIHARVGSFVAPQVSDPRAPEWQHLVELHLSWWQKIVEHNRALGRDVMTITPEFGPFPYMPTLPYTKQAVANQWDLNLYMVERCQEAFGPA